MSIEADARKDLVKLLSQGTFQAPLPSMKWVQQGNEKWLYFKYENRMTYFTSISASMWRDFSLEAKAAIISEAIAKLGTYVKQPKSDRKEV